MITDFQKSRNVIIAALIIGLSIGINFSGALGATINPVDGNAATGAISFTIGSVSIALSGLALASIIGIVINAILPGKNETFYEHPIDAGSLGKYGNRLETPKKPEK